MSWAPPPSPKDGLRRYNTGGMGERKEDLTRCIESVYGDWSSHQCYRKRGHGPDGLWCKQHNPEAVAAKKAARDARWEREAKEREANSPWRKLEQAQDRIRLLEKALTALVNVTEDHGFQKCFKPPFNTTCNNVDIFRAEALKVLMEEV